MNDDGEYSISGGIFFSHVVQGHHITVVLPPQVTPAMAGLPAASAAFTGRAQDLDRLLQVLAPRDPGEGAAGDGSALHAAGAKPVVVTAVGGMGGIGKTELVVQAARAALGRGWFAGGVLFVDMFGYDPGRRLTAAQAAAGFVRALGIPGEHVPADAQELERLLRSVLDAYATQGRPVLMVIDNVSDQAQAAPLLPAHPACRAIVTSRHTLGLLGAHLVDLDTLDTGEAAELLHRAIQVARPGDRRIADHPDDAARIAVACAGLPLALRIVAALLADNPHKLPAAMASELHDHASRLAELSYGHYALTTMFDLSYEHLPAEQARLFRLMPANPGPEISTKAAAVLAGLEHVAARRAMESLARAHLVDQGSAYGRWRMHDLVRLYADQQGRDQAEADDREQAVARLFVYYLTSAADASLHLTPQIAVSGSRFGDRVQCLTWLDTEYPNLAAVVRTAHGDGYLLIALQLTLVLYGYLNLRRHAEMITLCTLALDAARQLGDRRGTASMLVNLGIAVQYARRYDEAISRYHEAARIFRELGDPSGEAVVLDNLGNALQETGRSADAVPAHEEAARIFRETGMRYDEAVALNGLGSALRCEKRFHEAVAVLQDSARIFEEIHDRNGVAKALNNLGSVFSSPEACLYEEAIAAHQRALAIYQYASDRHGEAMALNNLGYALNLAMRGDEATAVLQDALPFFRESGDKPGEALALANLGNAFEGMGRFEEAITARQGAARIYRETGDRHSEGAALTALAVTLYKTGRAEEAITAFQQALQIYRDTGDRHGEGGALGNLGIALQGARRFEEAITANQGAAQVFRDTGDRHSEEIALNNLQETRQAQDDERGHP
jgi:tetratricopeptide (TPR) repeat protein